MLLLFSLERAQHSTNYCRTKRWWHFHTGRRGKGKFAVW